MAEDRYKIIKLLGKGRTGAVYEAEDTVLNRKIALRRFFGATDVSESSTWEESFSEIIQDLSAIQHPSIATIYDAGVDDEGAFVISQLVKGSPLVDRLGEGPINEWDVYESIKDMLDALAASHKRGFIHGAINPTSFIRVDRPGGGYRTVFIDFGLNKIAPLVQGGGSMAEPAFTPPEQFNSDVEDSIHTDIYMVGQFAYTCLLGGHPHGGKSVEEVAEAYKESTLPSIDEYNIPITSEFSTWVSRIIGKDPESRPKSIEELIEQLPDLTRPIDPAAAAIAAAKLNPLTVTGSVRLNTGPQATTGAVQLNTGAVKLNTGTQTVVAQAATSQMSATGMSNTAPQQRTTEMLATAPAAAIQPAASHSQNSSKNVALIAILGTFGVCLIGLILFLVLGGRDEVEDEVVDDSKPPVTTDGKTGNLESTLKINKLDFSKAKRVVHLSDALQPIIVYLSRNKGRVYKKNGVLNDVRLIGSPVSIGRTPNAVSYKIKNVKRPLKQSDMVGGPEGVKKGQGYKVSGVFPANSGEEIAFNVMSTTSNCDLKLDS